MKQTYDELSERENLKQINASSLPSEKRGKDKASIREMVLSSTHFEDAHKLMSQLKQFDRLI